MSKRLAWRVHSPTVKCNFAVIIGQWRSRCVQWEQRLSGGRKIIAHNSYESAQEKAWLKLLGLF